MKDWTVEIVCIVSRRKRIKRVLCIAARTYREAVRTAATAVVIFGRVRVRAWLAA